jgi:ParB family chromosome partitioning protein
MSKQALEGTRLNAFGMDPADLVVVGLDTEDGPEHPLYDERIKLPLDHGMVQSILRLGVLEPVVVRKNGDKAEVVVGRQRVRCARVANDMLRESGAKTDDLIRVPVMVSRKNDQGVLEASIAENEVRTDDTMIVKARKAARMIERGCSEADVAVTFRLTRQGVSNLLKLLDLDDKVQKAVEQGKLSPSAAITLTDIPRAEQVAKMEEMVASGAVGVVEAARQQRARRNGKSVEPRTSKVSVAVLRRVADNEEFMEGLSDDAKNLLQWILGGGDGFAKRIKGLTAVIKGDGADSEEQER